jgi:hypothetical protein
VASGVSALAAEDPLLVLQAWGGGLGEVLREEDFSAHPRLWELRLLHQAERQGGKAKALLEVMIARDRRGDQTPPDDLLSLLWQAGEWSYPEASEVLAALPIRQLRAGGIPAWLDRALQRLPRPGDPAERSAFLRLCAQLERHPVRRCLGDSTNRVLAAVQQASRRVRLAAKSKAPRAAAALVRRLEHAAPEVEAILLDRLPDLLLSLEPADLADLLPRCPRALTSELLTPMLTRWSPRERAALIAQLELRDPDSASAFAEWLDQHDRGIRGRLGRIRREWGRGRR